VLLGVLLIAQLNELFLVLVTNCFDILEHILNDSLVLFHLSPKPSTILLCLHYSGMLPSMPCVVQVKDFASSWRGGIQQINDDVLAYFANFRNGMEILKQVLTQLLLYYTRFQEIIKKSWSRTPSFARDIVSTATILMEIKRYSRTF
jgi:hypothetical protein